MLVDQKLILADGEDVAATGGVFGDVVVLPKGQDKSGFTSVVIDVQGTFTGAGTTKIDLCCGDEATPTPTVVAQPLFDGLAAKLVAGKTLRIGISPDTLGVHNRIKITNSATATGAKILAYFGFDS